MVRYNKICSFEGKWDVLFDKWSLKVPHNLKIFHQSFQKLSIAE